MIEENLQTLASLGEVSEDSFLRSFREYDAARYNLQATIEAMLDICNHVISRMTLGMSTVMQFTHLRGNSVK
ncbi:MAG: HepT-like ribonuclease domain-containing protein [Bacillota bacterium]